MSLRSAILALATSDDGGDGGNVRALADDSLERRLRPGDPMYNPLLADGLPLTYALYPDVNAPVASRELEQWARNLFRRLIATEPDLLVECEDKTLDEARALLVAAGVEGVPRVTKQVTVQGSGRYRIDRNITGMTPLSSSISIFCRSGRGERLRQATCYILGGNEGLYFDLPPAANINMSVGLRDPDGPIFVKVDPKTWEPVSDGSGGPAGVQRCVCDRVRDCGDVRED